MQAMTRCRCLRLLDYRQVTQPIGGAQQYTSGIEGSFGVTATRIDEAIETYQAGLVEHGETYDAGGASCRLALPRPRMAPGDIDLRMESECGRGSTDAKRSSGDTDFRNREPCDCRGG
jgi:hypothetical protein